MRAEKPLKPKLNLSEFSITVKPQRKPTYFSRLMNLANNFVQVFVYVVTIQYICSMEEELRIRISSKLKKELEAKAKELNISLSAYVRMKLSSNDYYEKY